MKILVAITGASGSLYAQRLLDNLDPRAHEIHVVLSNYANQVIATELPDGLRLPNGVQSHSLKRLSRHRQWFFLRLMMLEPWQISND